MANDAGFAFIDRNLPKSLEGMTVVEVGALAGGSNDIRPLAMSRPGPARYLGIDVIRGPGVDIVGSVEALTGATGASIADVVICAEVMEHVRDWRTAITEMKRTLKPGGRLLITTRSPGYRFHASPFDYWRYTVEDARAMVADMDGVVVEPDPSSPGIFISAVMPIAFEAADLSGMQIQSILTGHRELKVRERWVWRKRLSSPRRVASFLLPHDVKATIFRTRIGSRFQ